MTEKERKSERNTAAVSRPCYPETTLPQSQGQVPLCLPLFLSVFLCSFGSFCFFILQAVDPLIHMQSIKNTKLNVCGLLEKKLTFLNKTNTISNKTMFHCCALHQTKCLFCLQFQA